MSLKKSSSVFNEEKNEDEQLKLFQKKKQSEDLTYSYKNSPKNSSSSLKQSTDSPPVSKVARLEPIQ